MSNFVYFRGGNAILHDNFQSSNALAIPAYMEEIEYEWQNEYWEKVFKNTGYDIPMPLMVGNKPYWGGVFPPENVPLKKNKRYIADFKMKVFTVNESDVRIPNDQEYKIHFKRFIDTGIFKLVKMKNSYSGVQLKRR